MKQDTSSNVPQERHTVMHTFFLVERTLLIPRFVKSSKCT